VTGRRRGGWLPLRGGRERAPKGASESLPEKLPDAIAIDLDQPIVELWRARAEQALFETYAGLPCMKLPEDLRIYEHLLWLDPPEVVIELGTYAGGSTLWFRDRLRTLRDYGRIDEPHLIAIDTEIDVTAERLQLADPHFRESITLLRGDVSDPELVDQVEPLIEPGTRCLVIEDTAHTHETTIASLQSFARFVQPGGFYVVEDGGVDIEELRLHPALPRGVLSAVNEFLGSSAGAAFEQRRDLELYGLGCQPQGILQRRSRSAGKASP
jgi:cephalosporin hydroxylase